ncbi:SLAM family member 7 [Erethizon dorsatum]
MAAVYNNSFPDILNQFKTSTFRGRYDFGEEPEVAGYQIWILSMMELDYLRVWSFQPESPGIGRGHLQSPLKGKRVLVSVFSLSAASETFKQLVGAIGGSVTFSLNFTIQQVDSIAWTFNETNLVTVEPAMGDKKATVIVAQKRNKHRMLFQDGGYSLTFSQLKKTDSGIYSVVIHRSDSQHPLTWKYRLHVYERLSKPKVTMGLYSNKNGTCITNLTCFMEEGGEDVTYSWKALDQAANESQDGSILPVSWTLGGNDMTFICMARNPISSNSSSPIFARKLCEGDCPFFPGALVQVTIPSSAPNSQGNRT